MLGMKRSEGGRSGGREGGRLEGGLAVGRARRTGEGALWEPLSHLVYPAASQPAPRGGGAVPTGVEHKRLPRAGRGGRSLQSWEPAEVLGLGPVISVSSAQLPLGLRTACGQSTAVPLLFCESFPVWRVLDW